MTTNPLRTYINLLAEAEASIPVPNKQQQIQRAQDFADAMGISLIKTPLQWTAKGGVPVEIMGKPVPDKLFTDNEKKLIAAAASLQGQQPATQPATAPATAPATTADKPATAPTGGQAPSPMAATAAKEEDPRAVQQALVDAGFDVGAHGVDGKIGPDTRAAIKAAELTLGRTPTGKITLAELAGLKKAADAGALAKSLSAIEAVLAKYKVKVEEDVDSSLDQLILEHINLYTAQEQIEIWRSLTEADTSDIPAYLRKGTDQFANPKPDSIGGAGGTAPTPVEKPRLKWDPQTKNYYTVDAKGARTYQGGVGQAKQPADKTSKLAKFGKNLASRMGFGKGAGVKGAAKVGAKLGLRALPYVGWALLAYDVGSALYDTFSEKEFADLSAEDQAVIKANLPTILNYYKDPKMGESLPKELADRVRNVINGLNKLEVELAQ